MFKYKAEIDGEVVHESKFKDAVPAREAFGDYVKRPRETPAGDPDPSPIYLYEDAGDGFVLIGIQRSHADEAGQCQLAAAMYYAGFEAGHGHHYGPLAVHMVQMAADAGVNAQRALIAQAQEAI